MAAIDQGAADLAAAIVTAPIALADWLVIAPVVIPILTGALLLMIRHRVRLHASIAIGGLARIGGLLRACCWRGSLPTGRWS